MRQLFRQNELINCRELTPGLIAMDPTEDFETQLRYQPRWCVGQHEREVRP